MSAKKYIKLEPREHVLARPGMYIGSLESDKINTWIFENNTMKMKTINYISGLYKIFDEILVNALDHIIRLKSSDENKIVKEIRITIDKDSGEITVYNDGEGIEIVKDIDYKMYAPELIFGNMLTSSNYDDETERTIGGQNGIGAKACNIYSTRFDIETVDSKRKLLYSQSFSENMKIKTIPEIIKYTKYPYTKVNFLPDYERFGIKKLTKDMCDLFIKRAYDICALTEQNIKVVLNEKKLEIKSFEKYVDLYIGSSKTENPRVYDASNPRWEIVVTTSNDGFRQVSFVNGVCTQIGGKHVDYIVNQITKKIADMVLKKKKLNVKPQHIKDNLFVFIKSTIANPTFDSQTKDNLTTPFSKFGSKVDLDDKYIEKLYKIGIADKAISMTSVDDDKNAKKTDGKKKNRITVSKLDDANYAGTNKSGQCHLILTEGDSAKTMAVSGVQDRNIYGIFPLKGKVMNVKDVSSKKIWDNEEISNLKKIMGLESGKIYTDTTSLRYGKIKLMTDSDVDGSHIKGLIFNLFHTLWPSLLQIEDFMSSIMTPIIKVSKGKVEILFYNLTEYENWKLLNDNGIGWNNKYYKGLGTSTSKEAKEYFKKMDVLSYTYEDKKTNKSMELAFNKKKADERKEWIGTYDKNRVISYDKEKCNNVSYSKYVDNDLIHFSVYNLERAIPSICDGFKRSIRKIIFCCFKRKLYNEIKVAQLAGYVSEHGAYHHGEASLQDAIVGLAQNYIGSNNINLLMPNGQFGSRMSGGKDSASPRYIFTCLNPLIKSIFKEDDFSTLTYLDDDGMSIEPEFYIPIIPMILVNGALGIGTGYSTNIPSYNPKDIISNIRLLLNEEEPIEMIPWYKNFKGTISDIETKGTYKKLTTTKIEVTELPIQYWTNDFIEYLDSYIEKYPKILKDFEKHYTETKVSFILIFTSASVTDDMMSIITGENHTKFEKEFKLITTRPINTNNMHLFDCNGKIKKYNSPNEILKEFYDIRLNYYKKRKANKIILYEKDLSFLDNKMKFIMNVINGDLIIMNTKKEIILSYLIENNFRKIDDKYDYLIKMPIFNLTFEKKEELLKQYNELKNEYELYKKQTIVYLWTQDLDNLENDLMK
jgi:DNA topoisomerase-2